MTPESPPETVFAGKFRLVRLLGRGAMGEVWLAVEEGPRNFRRQVAVKRLLSTSDLSDYARESFVAEAQVIARLDHPNIVRLIELGETEEDHSLYLVLDFVDGAALDRLLKRGGPLSPATVAYLGREVAKALHAVHSMADEAGNNYGVVHRDVSPANILISRDGRVRLSDFGVARISGLGGEKTETGVFKGKLPYMPPEQAGGQPFDGRADCFSLGVTLFESLLGGRLRRAETQGQLIAMIATEQAPRVRDRIPGAPEHLAYAIDVATVFQPEQRVGSSYELSVLLDDALRAIDPRAEAAAIAELRERVALAADHSGANAKAPWSVSLNASGSHPSAPPSATSGSYPSAQSGSTPSAAFRGAPPPPPPEGADAVPTTISVSGRFPPRANPPSVPSGAYTAAGSMAGRLDASLGDAPPRKSAALTIAVAAGVSLLGIGAILFFVSRPPGPDSVGTHASGPQPSGLPASGLQPSGAPIPPPVASQVPSAEVATTPSADASGDPAASAAATTGPRTGVPPRHGPRPPVTTASTADAVDDTSPGTLQVIVVPWGNVSVDGKSYGTTPIAPVTLSPGTHTVVVTNSELGAQRSSTVKVLPGKQHAVKFDLKKSD